jgi:type I restriction enzyme M protein
MDAAEYKHLVLGLIFLKYVSDAFDERRREVAKLLADPASDLYFTEDPAEQANALEDRIQPRPFLPISKAPMFA